MADQYVSSILIRSATAADASPLSVFAARTFIDTYGADNSPEDMAAYVASTFTPELQAAELADPGGFVLIATSADEEGAFIGYAYLGDGDVPAAVTNPASIELKRFYVASQYHGRGVARTLMQCALSESRQRGWRSVWLGVWERNARAIAFYHKLGFSHVGSHSFQLGADVQTDWIMERLLDAPSSTG
ncbi:MAG: GNAT family N-acetyltransferase [Gemmatimonadaceae bacterium]